MMDLRKHIRENGILEKGQKYLVAVSGGADSVALLCLMHEAGHDITALHCNFHLRGAESKRDENFVRSLCEELAVNLLVRNFQTRSYAQTHGISIEMAAREQRYKWFEEVRKKSGAAAVCVAHHREDQAETLLLNLIRGAGIRGLSAMNSKGGGILRPLLDVSKKDLLEYLKQRGQRYVTDSTNQERDAVRNKLRLDVMPVLRQINPRLDETFCRTASILRETLDIYDEAVRQTFEEYGVTAEEMGIGTLWRHTGMAKSLLHEWLRGRGFNRMQEEQILAHLMNRFQTWEQLSGKVWESSTHLLLMNRRMLILRPRKAKPVTDDGQKPKIETSIVDSIGETGPGIAYFDADLITKPLTVRLVKRGDAFYPLGLGGRKLLSDFMTDLKFSLFQKQEQYVLCHDRDIIWVIGLRSDHRYRVTDKTQRIMKIIKREE